MKTASMLFGLVVSTAGIAHASPRTDANGDVACGNVMSKKSADDTSSTVRTAATPKPVPVVAMRPVPKLVPTKPIVQAIQLAIARPLNDSDGDMACGNVMTKGGRKHTCHATPAATAPAEDPVLAAFYAPPVKSAR